MTRLHELQRGREKEKKKEEDGDINTKQNEKQRAIIGLLAVARGGN